MTIEYKPRGVCSRARLEGIRCGGKATSCPDQLSRALRQALEQGA